MSNLLNAEMVGKILKLSKRQVFRLNEMDKIPAPIRIGGSIRWSEQIISCWLNYGCPDRKTFEALWEADND